MELIFGALGIVGLILLANWLVAKQNEMLTLAFHGLLFLMNGPILVMGLAFVVLPADLLAELLVRTDSNLTNLRETGLVFIGMAAWGMVVTLGAVRRLLARSLPIKPESPVHTLALMLSGYLVGQSALALSQGGLDGLAETAQPTSVGAFVLSELAFAGLAFLGSGLLVRRDGRQLLQRLGLERPTLGQLLIGVLLIGFLVILQTVVGAVWAYLNPEDAELLNDVNTRLLSDVDVFGDWLALALASGIGEELLFRGALQPILGLGFTSMLFALVHVQYGFTPILLVIFLLAVILGAIRRRYSTTVAIFVHTGYNFVLGLFVLLASYLERFVS